MKEVVDRIVQYPNRYKLTDVSTGRELGTYDFTEVTGTVQQVGTEINKELFDSIEADIEAAGNFDPNGTYPNLTAGNATHAANADAATSAASATDATHATVADSATSATNATNDGLGRNIANTYVLKGEEGWGLNLYACTISFSTTAAIYFCYPYRIFSFDIDDIANDLYSKGMRSITQAFPVAGIEPGGGQVVGMYSKNRSSITLAVITGAQLTEMSLPSGTLDKSSYI